LLRAAAREGEERNPATAQSKKFFGFINLIGVSNMKKSLIALAVAGLVSAPAFAATSNVDVYGVVNVAIQDTDVSNSDIQVTDNFSRIGFKGSEDLGGGLKAVWQIESGLGSGSDGMGTGSIGTRNTFVGLAGGFGTFVMGRHDTPYKIATGKYDIFGDTIADYNSARLDGVSLIDNNHDHRSSNVIAYISPSFSGLTIAAAVVATNMGANLPTAPANAVAQENSFDAISIAAMYGNGPLTVDVAYQDVDALDTTGWKVGAGYTMGDTKFGFVYEDVDYAGSAGDRDSWQLNVAHAMGPITLKAVYGQADVGNADQDLWALGADYALSKRTTAYFVYGAGDNDTTAAAVAASGTVAAKAADVNGVNGWNIGVRHSF
jgi:predicted porin